MLKFLETPITILHVTACLFLVLVILIQPGKSGGLGAAFGGAGAQQVFGGRGAGNLLTKLSWGTCTVFFLTSMTLAYIASSGDENLASKAKSGEEKKSDGDAKGRRREARRGRCPCQLQVSRAG